MTNILCDDPITSPMPPLPAAGDAAPSGTPTLEQSLFWGHPSWQSTPRLEVSGRALRACRQMASRAQINGVSRVRRDRGDRVERSGIDQLVGMIGQWALHAWWYGHPRELIRMRQLQDRQPHIGDGGSDLAGQKIDVKASLISWPRANPTPGHYHLPVRPHERHADTRYILALVEAVGLDRPDMATPDHPLFVAYLIGWAMESELPPNADTWPPFEGAYVLQQRELHPMERREHPAEPLQICWGSASLSLISVPTSTESIH